MRAGSKSSASHSEKAVFFLNQLVVKFKWAEKFYSDPFQNGTGFKSQELYLALIFELWHGVFLGWLDAGMHKLEKQREELLSAVL